MRTDRWWHGPVLRPQGFSSRRSEQPGEQEARRAGPCVTTGGLVPTALVLLAGLLRAPGGKA
ncbi:hypothetical protein, partial [Cellulosimicrobium sp. I38E]|uniref:hypothetical protein n=1 Tax=Cellulosimicrobium sp. I38E TaxID=1393139 RepID=UPI001C65E118